MKPRLSIVVIVYRMPHQARNTLVSLSAAHQTGVAQDSYEIVVVENRSDRLLGEEAATSAGGNIRYYLRENEGASPVPSLLFGIGQARGDLLALVIDGARMVTPRVVHYAMKAFTITDNAVVSIPGYHLGEVEQHRNPAHDEEREQRLLERIDWRTDGYRLFEISVFFRGRHQQGYLLPMMESNCVFFSREDYDRIGGIDSRFDMPGGGMVNLDLYKRLLDLPDTQLFVTPGEGTFHQFHGGVTTKTSGVREDMLAAFREQYRLLRGENYSMPDKQPRLLGAVPGWAMPALSSSAASVMKGLLPA